MGIGPVLNLIPLPVAQAIETDFQLSPMARVENSARNGDETYSPGGGESAGGSDDGAEDEFDDVEGQSDSETESTAPPPALSGDQPISFFA
ncbi:MAG: hypothetical protein WCC89_15740 [Candidatus Sulfotelmatobacter sp.]|jgi:hypothetical protein